MLHYAQWFRGGWRTEEAVGCRCRKRIPRASSWDHRGFFTIIEDEEMRLVSELTTKIEELYRFLACHRFCYVVFEIRLIIRLLADLSVWLYPTFSVSPRNKLLRLFLKDERNMWDTAYIGGFWNKIALTRVTLAAERIKHIFHCKLATHKSIIFLT